MAVSVGIGKASLLAAVSAAVGEPSVFTQLIPDLAPIDSSPLIDTGEPAMAVEKTLKLV